MPETTPRLGLKKPLGTDNVTRASNRENLDIMDAGVALQSDMGNMSTVPTTSKTVAGAITELHGNKVNKETGKGLSSNDYTTAEKNKLTGIAANANNYSHPTGDGNQHVPATGTGNNGKVLKAGATAGSASWQNLTESDIPSLSLSKISNAGTAAAANLGTSSGNVPVLGTGGKLDAGVLPAIAVTNTHVVASQTAMLALTAETGDVAVRTDQSKSYILKAEPASTIANWQELITPMSPVQSVAGKTGVVTLTKGDVGLANAPNYPAATQAQAEGQSENGAFSTPFRVAQQIDARIDLFKVKGLIPTNADFNSYTSHGIYSAGVITSSPNRPPAIDNYGVLEVIKDGSYLVQRYTEVIRGITYIRTHWDGTNWSAWKTVGSMVTKKPRAADLYQASAAQNTYYTLLNLTSTSGKLHRITVSLLGWDNQYINIRTTIDGIANVMNTGLALATQARGFAHNIYGSDQFASYRSYDTFLDVTFNSSLKIEVMQSNSNATALAASADYSIV